MKRLVFILVTISVLSGTSIKAGIKVRLVSPPFRPYVLSDRWCEIRANLSNLTDKTMRIKFVFPTESRPFGRLHFTRSLVLPPKTARTITLAQLNHFSKSKTNSRKTLRSVEQPYYIVDALTGKILLQSFMLHYPAPPHHNVIGYIDTEFPAGQTYTYLKDLPESVFSKVQLTNCTQQLLPDRWYGYSSLRLLIISAVRPEEMLDSQVEAILDWVRQGGAVVITSHSDAASTISGRIAQAAGVNVIDLHEEYYLDARSADGEKHFHIKIVPPMNMIHLCPWGAKVLWWANDLPLLTMRRYGAGIIFILAVPVGALSNKSAQPIWQTMANQIKLSIPLCEKEFFKSARETLPKISGRYSPGRTVPLLLIISQIILFVAVGIVLLIKHRGELSYAILIPASLLLSAGIFLYAKTLHEEPRLSFLTFVITDNDGKGHLRQLATYYSPETKTISISSGSTSGTIRPILSPSTSLMETTKISCDKAMQVEDIRIVRNSFRTFYTQSPITLPGKVQTMLRFGPKGLAGTITNQTGFDLFDALIVTGGKCYSIGDLPAGKTSLITVSDPPLLKHTFTSRIVRSRMDRLRNKMLDDMVYHPDIGRKYLFHKPFLVCWSHNILQNPLEEKDKKTASKGLSLLVMPIKIRPSLPGTKVVVPAGLLHLTIRSLNTPLWNPLRREFIGSSRQASFLLDFAPPKQAGELLQPRAILNITIQAANFHLRISGLSHNGTKVKKIAVKTIHRPMGKYKIVIDHLERFKDKQTDRYKLLLEILPIGKESAMKRWNIDSLIMTLEGISK